jgi:hypothetical protein
MNITLTSHRRLRQIIQPDWDTRYNAVISNSTDTDSEAVGFIRKVETVLEVNGQWPALRLQEYKRDNTLQEEPHDVLRPVADSNLTTHFRHGAKDACVLLPRLGRDDDARSIEPFLDPDLVKSWVQQCKANHSLCA